MVEGYSKDVLKDLTVNSWRPFLVALAIVAVVLALVVLRVVSPLFLWVVLIFGVYLAATLWASAGYAIYRTPDGGLPRSNGSLLLSLVVLLVPGELLK
jgi:hypothetical protein